MRKMHSYCYYQKIFLWLKAGQGSTQKRNHETMHLPSLKNIEAFEVAAKYQNFTKAGSELNLTSAAVSQRVAMLEETLGYTLFLRQGPKLKLTDTGKLCLPMLSSALMQMRETINLIENATDEAVLTIKASPSFAQKWLIPKLGDFSQKHPDVDLRIVGSTERIDIREGELIAAIYYGLDPHMELAQNLGVDHLFKERIFPVCSPDFLAKFGPLNSLHDIRKVPLLHDETMNAMSAFPSWQKWCDNFGIEDIAIERGMRFKVSEFAIQAAVEGMGLALGRGALVRHHIESGRLVRPFPDVYPLSFEYLFVYSKKLTQREDFGRLRNWIAEQSLRYEQERSEH